MRSWNSSTLATWCEELTHWKRPWCWERLRAEGEGDGRGWGGWMASPTQWKWVWVISGSWWWTRRPGVLQSVGSQRVGHDWATKLIWTNWTLKLLPLGNIVNCHCDSHLWITRSAPLFLKFTILLPLPVSNDKPPSQVCVLNSIPSRLLKRYH